MNKEESAQILAQSAISELNCIQLQKEYATCVQKYWKDKRKCDDQLKKTQVCLMRYIQPIN